MPITVIQGEQRGDEGKGKITDMEASKFEIVARPGGADNAGHTNVLPDGRVLALKLLPSGISHPDTKNVIGNGAYLNPVNLINEIEDVKSQGIDISPDNLLISSAAHLITEAHLSEDEIRETGAGRQGSTKKGVAQVAADKFGRYGVRAEAIKNNLPDLEKRVYDGIVAQKDTREKLGLKPLNADKLTSEYVGKALLLSEYITDTSLFLNRELDKGKQVLAECAQAYLLDIDHGMYPYVTSSATTANGVPQGLGVPARHIERVIGVSKAVQSHVGGGPFVTEIHDEQILNRLHGDMGTVDAETGTVTGRLRRLGHLDLAGIKRAQMVSGTTEMAVTKLDWLNRYGESILVCVDYERKDKRLSVAPDASYKLEQSSPIYEELPGWSEDIQHVRQFEDLPKNAQKYIKFIEDVTEVPVTMIGTGPNRNQVIVRKNIH